MTDTDRPLGASKRDGWPLGGIAGRVFVSTAAIVCAVLLSALAIASFSARRTLREAERRGLEQAADLTAQLLAGRGRSLAGGARVFVQGPSFRSLVAEHQHDDILDQTIEAATQLGADWVFITDDRGTLLAKSDEPSVQGVDMSNIPLIEGALEGRTTAGYGISRDTLLFQAVAVPIVGVPGAAPLGVLVATKLVDHQMALDVRAATGTEIVFYTLDTHGRAHLAASSLDSARQAAGALPADSPNDSSGSTAATRAAGTAVIGTVRYALHGAALTTAGGEVVGGFIVGRPEAATSEQIAGVRRSLIVAGLLGLVLALAASWSSARRVTRPARALATAATRALEGQYEQAAQLAAQAAAGAPSAEVAALGAALRAFLEELREKQALGGLLARGGSPANGEGPPPNGSSEPATEERTRGGRLRPVGGRARASALAPRLSPDWGAIAPPAGALAPGTVVADRYEIQEVLGVGGTGIVYRAVDRTLDEVLALKMLRPELVADDPRAREELKQELRLTRKISHRNIVRTYDFGSSRGVPFLSMEYVEGTSLQAVLAHRGALPPAVVLALAKQLMRALEAAHEQGVMHGDIKPANLLLATDGLLKVTDFGVASLVRRPTARGAAPADDRAGPPRLAGAVIGTPEYMAPELLLGGTPDVQSDLYAVGMVLQECLSGTTPFQGETPRAFFAQKFDTPPATRLRGPRSTNQPESLAALVAVLTAFEPEDRPVSAAEVAGLLAGIG